MSALKFPKLKLEESSIMNKTGMNKTVLNQTNLVNLGNNRTILISRAHRNLALGSFLS